MIGTIERIIQEFECMIFNVLCNFLKRNKAFLGYPDVEKLLAIDCVAAFQTVLVSPDLAYYFFDLIDHLYRIWCILSMKSICRSR
jgi:hypothetical protein